MRGPKLMAAFVVLAIVATLAYAAHVSGRLSTANAAGQGKGMGYCDHVANALHETESAMGGRRN